MNAMKFTEIRGFGARYDAAGTAAPRSPQGFNGGFEP